MLQLFSFLQPLKYTLRIFQLTKTLWKYFGFLCRQYFAVSKKNCLDQNRPYINTFQTILRYVCLSVILEFCLYVVILVFTLAYTSLCKGLKYLLKVMFIIEIDPNGAGFLIFDTVFQQHYPMFKKKYHKNGRHLRLVADIFTKLSQIVCLINTDMSICHIWLQVMECLLILLRFWRILHKIDEYPWLKCFIFTKHS